MHLPNRQRVNADLTEVAKGAKGLSGGDIKNVCLNSMYAGSLHDDPEQWRITQDILLTEIGKVKDAKDRHARGRRQGGAAIGFVAPTSTATFDEQA